jgi:MFS family permease
LSADDSLAPIAPAQLAGLLALGMLVGTINGLARVTMPLYASSVGAQPWQVGVIGGMGYAGLLLLALPMGAWIDRHGSRALFVRGVLVSALLYMALPWVRVPWQLMGAAWLLGLTLPFRTVPAQTEFLALVPRLSAGKAGWNRAANTVGMFFLGPAVGAAVIAALGFAPVFYLAAGALLGAAVLALRVLAHHGDSDDGPQRSGLRQRMGQQIEMLRAHADVRQTMAIDFLNQMAVAYFVVFALILAVQRFGLGVQQAAGLITVQGALFVLTLFAAGAWLERLHEDARYLLAFALLALQSALYGFGPWPAGLWLGAAAMGLGVGVQSLTSVNRFARLMQLYGRGLVGGVTSLAGPAGGVLGAMLGGLVSQRLGIEAGFQLLALVYVALAVQRAWRLARRG